MTASVHRLPSRAEREAVALHAFCGHCGSPPEPGPRALSATRVCRRCDLGLLLHAPADVAPAPGDAFLVIDDRLAICGLSAAAEGLLGVQETTAVNRHLGEFLLPADAGGQGAGGLVETVLSAASGAIEGSGARMRVRPVGVFGVRLGARIGRCGPAPSALIVLER